MNRVLVSLFIVTMLLVGCGGSPAASTPPPLPSPLQQAARGDGRERNTGGARRCLWPVPAFVVGGRPAQPGLNVELLDAVRDGPLRAGERGSAWDGVYAK